MDEKDIENYIYEKYYNIVVSETEKIKLNKYNDAIDNMNVDSEKSLKKASKLFGELGNYMDSEKKMQECEERLKQIKPKGLFGLFKTKNKIS